jgi:hypothetical protein
MICSSPRPDLPHNGGILSNLITELLVHPPIAAALGFKLAYASSKQRRTSAGLPIRRPAAKSLYAGQGFKVALIALNIRGGSDGK